MTDTAVQTAPPAPARKALPSFPKHSPLRAELNQEVDAYFQETGLPRNGSWFMIGKTLTILAWVAVSYGLLLFWAQTWWQAVPLAVSLGLALAGVGFSIMHDGGHGSYSDRGWLNSLSAAALDMLGGSSYVWAFKHNVLHHTYTNVDGVDDDIELRPFFRLARGQKRTWMHRHQWWYWVPLFAFFTTKWVLIDDFLALATGKVGGQSFKRPGFWGTLQLLGGKVSFALWAVTIPLLVVPLVPYLIYYVIVSTVWGVTMGMVFQLAHAVEGVEFDDAGPERRLQRPFVEHQLATTADFARDNPLITWYVGGLNFQVEHHLYPRISHRHYPALARIVERVCARHGIPHRDNPTLWRALKAHLGYLWRLGHED